MDSTAGDRGAHVVLQPPQGVRLAMSDDGTLAASGEAPGAWMRDATLLARTLPGVRRFDPSGLANAELREAARRLEAAMVQFTRGSAQLAAGQEAALAALVKELQQLDAVAEQWSMRYRVTVTGHTDADGPPDRNLALSRERAEAVIASLPRGSLAALVFEARGAGSTEPLSTGTSDDDKQRNRRVAVRIEPLAAAVQP